MLLIAAYVISGLNPATFISLLKGKKRHGQLDNWDKATENEGRRYYSSLCMLLIIHWGLCWCCFFKDIVLSCCTQTHAHILTALYKPAHVFTETQTDSLSQIRRETLAECVRLTHTTVRTHVDTHVHTHTQRRGGESTRRKSERGDERKRGPALLSSMIRTQY